MKLNHLPTFETTLPVTQQKVIFRPFVMKEEKILLLASESGDKDSILRAINESVKACTSGKVTCDTHPMVDIQKLFLEIRGKSVGEIIEFNLVCGNCKKTIPSTLNTSDIQVKFFDKHNTRIELTSELIVTLQYPKLEHLGILSDDNTTLDDVYNMVADCIVSIQTSEEVYDRNNSTPQDFREFVDNITTTQFVKIKEFFDTMPVIHHDIRFVCPKCERNNVVNVNEIVNFFV
jgi:hypothetical protein